MDIDADQLLTFLVVAEQGSLTAAGHILHRGQPAISERLQKLSAQVGEPLYRREGRGIRLTPAGKALLEPSRKVRAALDDAAQTIVRRRRLQGAALRIAATPTLAHYFLPRRVAAFQRRHSDVLVYLKGSITDGRQTAYGDCDLLFLEGHLDRRHLPPHYIVRSWHKESIACVVAPGHPLLGATRVTWPDVLRYPMIWRDDGPGVRETLVAELAAHGLTAPFRLEVGSVDAVIAAVMAGTGIGFVAQSIVAQRPDWPIEVLTLPDRAALHWTLYVAAPEAPYQSPAVRSFLALLLADVTPDNTP
ncbi:MAG: LysR family transcriptional regulator [Acidiferrobacter thiooxydans]